jgi:SAM-dependent methyltransferase
MKVDCYDNTMICEDPDLQDVFIYFKNDRIIPDYIEKAILKTIHSKLLSQFDESGTVYEYLEKLPLDFVKKTIKDINTIFSNNGNVSYKGRHLSYLMYYMPGNIYKVWKPLMDLQFRNALKPKMRILDVGTGPGSVPIGIIEYYKALAEKFPEISFGLSLTLIECEQEFLDIALSMIHNIEALLPPNMEVAIKSTVCKKIEPGFNLDLIDQFDMITMSNFLSVNEGENQKNSIQIIKQLKEVLRDDGSIIIIEPGNSENCIALKKARNKLSNQKTLNIFSPCIGIWEEKYSYDCSCFNMVRCYWQIPIIYKFLIKHGLDKAKRIDVPFNYLVLRKDNLKKYPLNKNQQHYTKLVDLTQKIGQTVNIIALIRTVIYKGNSLHFALCDGSCSFSDDSESVWIYTTREKLEKCGIAAPLISAERIKLKKVLVKSQYKNIVLEINDKTSIEIEY